MKKFTPLLLSSVIIIFFTWCLLDNYAQYFESVRKDYVNKRAVNLSQGFKENVFADVLIKNNYVDSVSEAQFIARSLTSKLDKNGALSNINDLKKRVWQLDSGSSIPAGTSLSERLANTKESLGQDALPIPESMTLAQRKSGSSIIGKGNGAITVVVQKSIEKPGLLDKFLGKDKLPVKDIYVRLSVHTLNGNDTNDSIVCYQKTNDAGVVQFTELADSFYYSVLPIAEGMEFGPAKGTSYAPLNKTKGAKDSKLKISFQAKDLKIRLFNDLALKQIRDDKKVTVRTPDDFRSSLYKDVFIVIVLFWILAYLIHRKNRKEGTSLLSILLLITGVGIVNMYGLADPLVDSLIGTQNAKGVITGLVIAILLTQIDIVKFYQDRSVLRFDILLSTLLWFTLPYRQKIAPLAKAVGNPSTGVIKKLAGVLLLFLSLPLIVLNILVFLKKPTERFVSLCPKGTGYLLAAIMLTALLFTPFGTEVGGMKVNLDLGFGFPIQPSEVAKYLIVVFMAAFFCEYADTIIRYSKESKMVGMMFRNKFRLMFLFLCGIAVLMGIYLLLGDMGPALVILVTFVLLYSMIKSTVSVSSDDASTTRLGKIMKCDFALLVCGVVSFIALVAVGSLAGDKHLSLMLGFCWFPLWIVLFYARKQVQESAILFNAILFLFLFGGSILGLARLDSAAERFDQRMEMCRNTWGVIDMSSDGYDHHPTSNSQVASGLWGLASGGLTGQGIGQGTPQFIPAFNTDMVMMSFGENMGFVSVALILVLYALLLWQTLRVGYRAKHGFALYLCFGITIVTGVQLMTIIMGALGLVPLTGVTVPFMSFGMSSLVMNMIAYGLVLSVLAHTETTALTAQAKKELDKTVKKYNYPISLLSVVGLVLFFVVVGSFFNSMVWSREDTMIRPVFSKASNGRNVIEYNPRLLLLSEKMRAGNIYDRNDLVIATSDKSLLKADSVYEECDIKPDTVRRFKRYYPFAEHLFFMLGDFNTKLLWNYDNQYAVGYLAENQHLAKLRGYDNRYRVDENGQHIVEGEGGTPKIIEVTSENVKVHRFAPVLQTTERIHLRDYSALIPYLKSGINSKRVERFNKREEGWWDFDKIKPKDVKLTLDAKLQVLLQQRMAAHINKNYHGANWNKVRASVVVLDAQNGDLLASANYPVADYNRIKEEAEKNEKGTERKYYYDSNRPADWKAYTDRDLAMTFQTPPGSTAKVMSSLAFYRKCANQSEPTYFIDREEIIFSGEASVSGRVVGMSDALRYSSNCYFVNLVNDKELYPQLADIYGFAGVRVSGDIPYTFDYAPATKKWRNNVTAPADQCISAYKKYKESGKKEKMSNRTGKPSEWSWAWGQNGIEASPLTMARVVSIAANDGRMPETRYTFDSKSNSIEVISSADASRLNSNLKRTAREHDKFDTMSQYLGGKTGTPERIWYNARNRKTKINDGWYICFIEDAIIPSGGSDKLAVAVRMERINDGMSGRAVKLTKEVVLEVLTELGYIR